MPASLLRYGYAPPQAMLPISLLMPISSSLIMPHNMYSRVSATPGSANGRPSMYGLEVSVPMRVHCVWPASRA